jgi:FixJ family two-component response regulator
MIAREEQPIVFVIDDDASVREGVGDLLRSVGLGCSRFDQRKIFLRASAPMRLAVLCLTSDCRDRVDWNFSAP